MKITIKCLILCVSLTSAGCTTTSSLSKTTSRDMLTEFSRPQASMFIERADAPARIVARSLAIQNSNL